MKKHEDPALSIVKKRMGLTLVRRPDEDNSVTPDIDAILVDECSDPYTYYAVEHTSVDYLPNQRGHIVRFKAFIGDIELRLSNQIPIRLTVSIPFDFDRFIERRDYAVIRKKIEQYLLYDFWKLPLTHNDKYNISGVPFPLLIWKDQELKPKVVFMPLPPANNVDLPQRLFDQFERKIDKLKTYQSSACRTALLVENKDGSLVDVQGQQILNAILTVYNSGMPTGIDKIWYVDTVGDLPDKNCFRDFTPYLDNKSKETGIYSKYN